MLSYEDRYAHIIARIQKLGHDPVSEQIRELHRDLEQLDDEVKRAAELSQTLRETSHNARVLLAHANDRARRVRAEHAARVERELHDYLYPTVLGPEHSPETTRSSWGNWGTSGWGRNDNGLER